MRARTGVSASRLDGLADRPELRWNAFQYGTLVLLYEFRERARKAAVMGSSLTGLGPEETVDELLDQIRAVGAQANVEPELVEMALEDVQRALYRHITVPGRWGSWAALQSAVQEAAETVAVTVASIADEMVEIRDEYRHTTSDTDADETVASMNRLIDMMRVAVVSVQAAGAPARS